MKQKMWLSKYALSEGIKEVEVFSSSSAGYAFPVGYYTSYKIGKDLHETRESAVVAAKLLKAVKVVSLQKQLAKLEKLEF